MWSSQKLLALPYALTRVPITVIDRLIVQQLPLLSRPRLVFDHGLGVADHWAGLVLSDARISEGARLRIDHAGQFTGTVEDMRAARGTRILLTPKAFASTRAWG